MKFAPSPFLVNPTPEKWTWWRQCFINGLEINEITDDKHKLTFLRTQTGSKLLSLLANSVSFLAALSTLDSHF